MDKKFMGVKMYHDEDSKAPEDSASNVDKVKDSIKKEPFERDERVEYIDEFLKEPVVKQQK